MVDAIDSKSVLGNKVLVRVRSSAIMELLAQFSLLCFDFDGLLVDTETLHFRAYEQMLKDLGFDLGLTYQAFIKLAHDSTGQALKHYVLKTFPIVDHWETLREKKMKIYTQMILDGATCLMPNVALFLEQVLEQNFLTCVVTNSFRRDTEIIKSHLPLLKQIPHWFTRETYPLPKPAPDGYLAALSHFNIPKEKAVGFEDTLKGVSALKQAQIYPILICDKSHPQLLETSDVLHFESFSDILLNRELI